MKFIVGKNDSGKTRELIKQSLDRGIPIFALYESKAESLRAKSISYFGKAVQVVTPQDFAFGSYRGDILVDDMEKAFTALLADFIRTTNFNVITATVTED
jgi:hypothetical protein